MTQTPAEQLTDEQLFTLFREQIDRDDKLLRELVAQRKRLGVSQSDLARLMETDQGYLSRLESGSINPRVRTLREYAVALGMEIHHTLKPHSPSTVRADSVVESLED
ncbi:helix-turn-helix domain-containing protein [Trueperella bialowiezensis]|uniref:Transcriptional regulator, y4mF family n=1 Tax=Trueperella bialowiezensis TaxID=312285 RepID=A0A448PGF5_9ACTO|nr:helix-turn-helix transcriptional regulator [Trueperella bialowiezensis]VEI13974.1 transcriptional regulator, y4mF family [Trueperella bialowiezensis]